MATQIVELSCPVHENSLTKFSSYLECKSGCRYSILKGIPRFVSQLYTEAFGFQWKIFDKTQLDSYSGTSVTRRRLVEAMGSPLSSELADQHVLEVGCGAGRFTEILLDLGAMVYSIDHSNAVEVNTNNFPQSQKHIVVQADVGSLPYAENAFDVVFCLGVIQHTPDPEVTIRNLARHVKPGGWLVIDHYSHSISWYLRTAPLFRQVLKRLDPQLSFRIVSTIFKVAIPFYKISANRYYRKLLHIVFPIVYFENEIPELPTSLKLEWGLLDTYDSLTDWNKHRRSTASITQSLIERGFVEIECFNNGSAVVARARKQI
jgi:2-polyprenyl-3-methyl-5-hydroxy-6-metoxy-1,4-benzoquinol methylase